jgi:putative Holliday junction resolvase
MYLGIDLGKKTTGLAISSGKFATPFKTITHKSISEAIEQISNICNQEFVDKVVLGFVEGKIKSLFIDFAKKFQAKNPAIEVVMVDETFTTRQAQDSMIKLQISKNKRRAKEHEIAACIILQSYLEEHQ